VKAPPIDRSRVARAKRLRAFYNRKGKHLASFRDPGFWKDVADAARLATGLDVTADNWYEHSREEREAFGRACQAAQACLLRPPK